MENLKTQLRKLNRQSYGAYKSLKGTYQFPNYLFTIHHVQGDPFAAPSILSVTFHHPLASKLATKPIRRVAVCDFLLRVLNRHLATMRTKSKGSGKSGRIDVLQPGQEVLFQTAVTLKEEEVTVRFRAGLPAFGRRIAAREAEVLLFTDLPKWMASIYPEQINQTTFQQHVDAIEDAEALRAKLDRNNLIAFVANGANLPRRSGVDNRPLQEGVRFQSPTNREITFQLPHRTITGMGFPKGVHLIVGGGFHGKSTLLNALQSGLYNHIPGDGREFVVSSPKALKVRSEDGHPVTRVNISAFINNLPGGRSTADFSTPNASGSTSQAANLLEGLEAGANTLLMDEDTSATNFMIRDMRMQELVPKVHEPITPFLDKVRQLFEQHQVSTILVVGGSGSYLAYADYVTCMIAYQPYDYTRKAMEVVEEHREKRVDEGGSDFGAIPKRRFNAQSVDARFRGRTKIKTHGCDYLQLGNEQIDLKFVEQLVHPAQVNALGEVLASLPKNNERLLLRDFISEDMEAKLLELAERGNGNLMAFRPLELAATLNRYRRLDVEK